MIKIVAEEELKPIKNMTIKKYISNLLRKLLDEYKDYCIDGTISSIGTFFILETKEELNRYEAMGLLEPITKHTYEWIDEFSSDYCNIAVLIDADKAVNIIVKRDELKKFLEEQNEND